MKQVKNKPLHEWLFNQVHSKNLVYNCCWEDPRCDRGLMEFNEKSEIVMISSAGCNALDYLQDNPKHISCIDVNPRQNALLQLKLATFKSGTFEELFQLFGQGFHHDFDELYRQKLRPHLSDYAAAYWDKNLKYFNGKGLRKSFYNYGTSGTFAWMANNYLKTRRKLHQQVQALFAAESLEEQAAIYNRVENKILNKVVEWFLNRHLTLCLVGVPRSQQQLFMEKYENGAMGFIQDCLRKVFTELPLKDNYFYRLYFEGAYTADCCPSYLKADLFDQFQERCEAISTHTTTISQFLKDNPGAYSHFILLDHQDWLACNNVPALEEEWALILRNSRPGTKVLLRSAAETVDFFPDFVKEKVRFDQVDTTEWHHKDRVGTYASVYLGIVQ